jgi:hypothetical protein
MLLTGDASATDPVCTLSPMHQLVEAVVEQVNRNAEAPDAVPFPSAAPNWVYRVDPPNG